MSTAYECHNKKYIFKKIIIIQKKSLRPRCAIDQNAFRFPGARPNMAVGKGVGKARRTRRDKAFMSGPE